DFFIVPALCTVVFSKISSHIILPVPVVPVEAGQSRLLYSQLPHQAQEQDPAVSGRVPFPGQPSVADHGIPLPHTSCDVGCEYHLLLCPPERPIALVPL